MPTPLTMKLFDSNVFVDRIGLSIPFQNLSPEEAAWQKEKPIETISEARPVTCTFDGLHKGLGRFRLGVSRRRTHVKINGNPQSFASGQNTIPSFATEKLVETFVREAMKKAPDQHTEYFEKNLASGSFSVHNIHLGLNFWLPSPKDGPRIIEALHGRMKSSAQREKTALYTLGPRCESAYYRAHDDYWILKAYLKGPEFTYRSGRKSRQAIPAIDQVGEYAQHILRLELELKYNELRERNLLWWNNWLWGTSQPRLIFMKYLSRFDIDVPYKRAASDADQLDLPLAQRLALQLYEHGEDLKVLLPSERTYRDYRSKFKQIGINIDLPPDSRDMDLLETLHQGQVKKIPPWAKAAGLFPYWKDSDYISNLRTHGRQMAEPAIPFK